MPVNRMDYAEARPLMLEGDIIAFSGKGNLSELIKNVTRSQVSHIGIILKTRVTTYDSPHYFNEIIESTSLDGKAGVMKSRLSEVLARYHGDVWWLPLNRKKREKSFDPNRFFEFLYAQVGKPYDYLQAMLSALDALDELPFGLHGPFYNRESFDKFFCSELAAAGLEASGMVGSVNASEVTPIDLCRWKIYEDKYCMLKQAEIHDPPKEIKRFNTMEPELWT